MTTPGRNAPCPCGSGRKYKKCCLAADERRRDEEGKGVPDDDDRTPADADAAASGDPFGAAEEAFRILPGRLDALTARLADLQSVGMPGGGDGAAIFPVYRRSGRSFTQVGQFVLGRAELRIRADSAASLRILRRRVKESCEGLLASRPTPPS